MYISSLVVDRCVTDYRLSGAVYLAVLILLTTSVILSVSKEDPSVYDASLTSDVIRAFCEVVVIIACLYTLAHETVDIFRLVFISPYLAYL